ncbi:SLC13 family permease [Gynuella sp.]|uniref:SLC13 family permease n=1 Tax=Gynuella sp. TaxID=2969146 RepID=UPI003D131ED4
MSNQQPSSPTGLSTPVHQKNALSSFWFHPGFRKLVFIMVLTVTVAVVTGFYLSVTMAMAATLTVFCIAMWATAVMPEYWTSLLFFLVAIVLHMAPVQTVFSGFYSSPFWLLFSGMVLGAAIRHTRLDQRVARRFSGMLGHRYRSIIAGIVTSALLLAFVMPSAMGRIVLIVPIILALADHLGYESGSKGRTGMVLAASLGTFLPAFSILPSNTPNMILAAMAENLHGLQISYWDYFLLHFPVLGMFKAILLVMLILWLYPDRDPLPQQADDVVDVTPLTSPERRLIIVLGLSLLFWLTDAIHHVSPGWVGLAAALYCLAPISGLTKAKCLNTDINFASLFFVAGIIGLGAVISASGLGEALVRNLSGHAHFSSDQPLWNIGALTVISTLVAMVTNLPGIPAVMTPLASDLASLTGLPLATVLMTQVLAFSNVFMPYQAPPLITAMSVGKLPMSVVTRMCLTLFVIGIVIVAPLDLLWWHILGLL